MKKILSKKVSEVMTKKIVTLKPDDELTRVEKLFNKLDYNAFPVVDENKVLVGLVTKTDYLKTFTTGISVSISKVYNLWAKNVSDIMTKSPSSVGPDSEIIDAANIMVEYKYRSVPVVDKNNKLIGIITSSNIVKYTMLEIEKNKKQILK